MRTCYAASRLTAAFILTVPLSLSAQERPAPSVEFGAAWIGFVGDAIVAEGLLAGDARFYVLPRVSLGPEVAYIQGADHSHLMMTANLMYDYPLGVDGRLRRVVPFAIVGGGMLRTQRSAPARTFTSAVGGFAAGGGVRVRSTDRVTVGMDVRIGWYDELHMRVGGTVGVRLGH